MTTPAELGYRMAAEWEPHAGCLMVWPVRADLWGDRLAAAKAEYAGVARAVAAFEPVVMVCPPGTADDVRAHCGDAVTAVELPVDDSWARDSGPVFVTRDDGAVAVVDFVFTAWGERWHPYADDDRLAGRVAQRLGLPSFRAPMVLEGGAFLVDGEGTLLTTEQCLLAPNRNPAMSRSQLEDVLAAHLGVSAVVWLPYGAAGDDGPEGTDGHVDGVAQYLAPGRVLLEAPSDPAHPDHDRSRANLAALAAARDAAGRAFDVRTLEADPDAQMYYANHYVANGGVVVPLAGRPADDDALAAVAAAWPGRAVVGVPATTIAYGGGGPHCITQQVPAGVDLAALGGPGRP